MLTLSSQHYFENNLHIGLHLRLNERHVSSRCAAAPAIILTIKIQNINNNRYESQTLVTLMSYVNYVHFRLGNVRISLMCIV